ncbi:DNA polymerase [Eubacteriaceae bacterium ES2]|nr:DNA polymerase [Eubacteriaceae bacterium ES2]
MKKTFVQYTEPLESVLTMLEEKGIIFDANRYYHEILEPLHYEQEELRLQLHEHLHLKRNASIDNDTDIMWDFYKTGHHPLNLTMEYLKEVQRESTAYDLLFQHKKIRQFLGPFGQRLLDKLDAQSCLHGHWSTDTATGRLKCRSPALQGFPKQVSRYFTAPKGFVLITGDYSHIDLRVLAQLSQDEILIKAFNQAVDIHRQTASAIFEKDFSQITEPERQIAKKINFSIIYGISSESLWHDLRQVNHNATLQDAKNYRDNFFSTYQGVVKWQNEALRSSTVYGLNGLSWSSFRTINCHLNYPIQGSAAAGLKLALILLFKNLKPNWYISHTVHDEIQIIVPGDDAESGQMILKQAMIEGMSYIVKDLPIDVKTEIKYSTI